jgi:hypothetical protein
VLSSSTHCWVTQTQPTPRSTRLDCIDFDIDPPVPTPSTSIASSAFVYIFDGPDCVNLGITPFHDDLHQHVTVITMAPLVRLQLHQHGYLDCYVDHGYL